MKLEKVTKEDRSSRRWYDDACGTALAMELVGERWSMLIVRADADAGEDEGWVIGLVVDLLRETTDLAIIDARNFTAAPVASVRIPHRIPPGFHGNWLPRSA